MKFVQLTSGANLQFRSDKLIWKGQQWFYGFYRSRWFYRRMAWHKTDWSRGLYLPDSSSFIFSESLSSCEHWWRYKSSFTSGRWSIHTWRDIMSSITCHCNDSINGWIDGRKQSAGRWGGCRYIICTWNAAGAHVGSDSFDVVHLLVYPHPPPTRISLSLPPFLSSGSSVVLRETAGKVSHFLCRAIAPQLLVSPPLPSLFALPLSSFCPL